MKQRYLCRADGEHLNHSGSFFPVIRKWDLSGYVESRSGNLLEFV